MEILRKIQADIQSVRERDPAARSTFDVITTYPGFHARCIHRITHFLWNKHLFWPARFIAFVGRWLTGIEIHPGAKIGARLFIDHGMGVVIGETAEIGDDCTLYHGVTLGGISSGSGKRHPTLGHRVVAGAGAKILGPITIGDDARIGSNSVVLKSVPPNTTVVGIPGHLVSKDRLAKAQQLQHIARQLRFDAYGMTPDMPDPVAHAVNQMLQHIHCLQHQLAGIKALMREQGWSIEEINLGDLSDCQLDEGDEKPSGENVGKRLDGESVTDD